jgi:ribonuclease HI
MKYYAVRYGLEGPKVYTDWTSCQAAVKGFKGAKFKSFTSQEDADAFIEMVEDVLTSYPEGHHITVDASSSIKEDFWEFQMVWSDSKELIYRSPTYKGGTNNTGEVLGLAYAIKYRSENSLDCNIYCDSMTAISACEKGSYSMKSANISLETMRLVHKALGEIMYIDRSHVIHWNNAKVGIEIPSDFGRK